MENQLVSKSSISNGQQVASDADLEQLTILQKKLAFFPVLIIILVTATIFGLGGYYYGQHFSVCPIYGEKGATNNNSDCDLTFSTQTETLNNWSTFSVPQIRLSFQYPSSWSVQQVPTDQILVSIYYDPQIETGLVPMQISMASEIDAKGNEIHLNTIKEAETYYLQSFDSDAAINDSLTIGGKIATSIEGKVTGPGPSEGEYLKYILIQLEDGVLVIQQGDKQREKIYNQILSTFTFRN